MALMDGDKNDNLYEEYACKIPNDKNSECYSLQTYWFKNKVTINIWDNISVWSGEVTTDALREFSSALGLNYEEYFLECKQVLTKNGRDNHFVYSIENSHFVWKKIDPCNNIRVKFGSVEVRSVPFTEDGIEILNFSFNSVLRLSAALRAEEERKLKYDEEVKSLKQKLTKLCEEKDLLEKELYVKFLSILNQKKEKIGSLEARCEQGVSPKKGRSNLIYSDSESDVDDPSRLTCGMSAGPSVKQRGKTASKKTDRQPKRKLDVSPTPVEIKPSVTPSVGSDGKDHYDSDTDVDMTSDEEEKPTFNFVSSEPQVVVANNADDDLLSEMNSPPAVLPKRIRQNAVVEENGAGPSFRKSKVKKLPEVEELPKTSQSHYFNTQDLFDDLGGDN